MITHALLLVSTSRTASEELKPTILLLNGIGNCIQAITNAMAVSGWEKLGVPAGGVLIQTVLYGTVGLVNILASKFPLDVQVAPVKKPLYWGVLGFIVLFAVYIIMSVCATDTMVEGFAMLDCANDNGDGGDECAYIEGKAYTVVLLVFKYAIAPELLANILVWTGHIITKDVHATYVLNRLLTIISAAWFFLSAADAMSWTAENAGHQYDKIITAHRFKMFLFLIFAVLSYMPVMLIDPKVKTTIQMAVEDETYNMMP